MVRASCLLQLALGNIGKVGGGANIFRGHDNVQGVTDVGPNPDSLPGYYGMAEGSFKHYAAVWGVDFEWIKKQYAPGMMTKPGMTVSRWFDAVLEKNELIDQASNLRGLFYWGHAPNSQTRGLDLKRGDGQARPAGRGRSLPVGHGGDGGDARQGRGPEPEPRRLPAAGVHAVRDQRFVHRLATARCSGARRSSSRCSNRAATT